MVAGFDDLPDAGRQRELNRMIDEKVDAGAALLQAMGDVRWRSTGRRRGDGWRSWNGRLGLGVVRMPGLRCRQWTGSKTARGWRDRSVRLACGRIPGGYRQRQATAKVTFGGLRAIKADQAV